MKKNCWLTPEEILKKKKRNKVFLYGAITIGSIILSTLMTFLANEI